MIALQEHAGRENVSREISLGTIEGRCAAYDRECAKLEDMIGALESDLEAVKQKHLSALKRQAAVVARREAEGLQAVERGAALFQKPKTLILHGVKAGLATNVGKLVFDDAVWTLQAIRRFRKDDVNLLIRTKEEPDKDALKRLPVNELAQLGCRIEGAGEVAVFARVAGEVEKLMNKMIEKLVEVMIARE